MIQTQGNYKEFTVSEIAAHIKQQLEINFSNVRITGEISGLKFHQSGHIYFNIKDESALINAICFTGDAYSLKIKPEEGMQITATGRITSYAPRSNYQIIVNNIQAGGVGELMALFEKRKKLFAQKGYFSNENKKQITKYPKIIGIITSETGAVIKDIIHRVKERFPCCQLLLHPVATQGNGAELEIANAINAFNEITEDKKPQTLIIARGGGSVEDLWCFNEEIIIQATYNSQIPIISAIGHETDTTLLDYAADLRAPTPTAAAELATPVKTEILSLLENNHKRLTLAINRTINELQTHLKQYSYVLKSSETYTEAYFIKMDDLTDRLNLALENFIKIKAEKLKNKKLNKEIILNNHSNKNEHLLRLTKEIANIMQRNVENKKEKIANLTKLLDNLNHKNTLKRGYAIMRNQENKIINKISDYQRDKSHNIELTDGKIQI
jgi:exodeoxyribonuclease VII large subunit